jgi:hypothetical protein
MPFANCSDINHLSDAAPCINDRFFSVVWHQSSRSRGISNAASARGKKFEFTDWARSGHSLRDAPMSA